MKTFQIWYMRPDWFRNGVMGDEPDATNLDKTHIHLKDIELDLPLDLELLLERIYQMMQGVAWSPNGEARPLIEAKGLDHTSMCTGDVVRVDGKTFVVVVMWWFKELPTKGEQK